MNRTYEEWLKYYENATKEQVIEDMMLDLNIINKAIEYIENDMPYLEEPDDDYENNHKMIEFDRSDLLKILRGNDNESN